MHLLSLAAVAALSASASAYSGIKSNFFNSTCNADKPRARIVNNCPYTVWAWTVDSDDTEYDCKFHDGLEIPSGGFYWENYRPASVGAISIKIGKEDRCNTYGSIVQLEYNIVPSVNFLDVSYVDCPNRDCPTATEGWKLVSGNENGRFQTAGLDKSVCPIISCSDIDDCAPNAYILPDDIATKSCDKQANLDFYMCGAEGSASKPKGPSRGHGNGHGKGKGRPDRESENKPDERPHGKPEYSAPAPAPVPTSAVEYAAARLEAPAPTQAPDSPRVVKTELVYTTVHVNAHARAHRRRHQNFHA